jgi:hypothetical protein
MFYDTLMKIPVKFPIEVGKKYYTEDGREVRIYATDAGGVFPIHGAVFEKCEKLWIEKAFSCEGKCQNGWEERTNIMYEEWTPSDKELVWCWDKGYIAGRVLGFYDAVNQCIFTMTGERDGGEYEHYAPFEGEHPEWAKETVKKLED